MLTPKSYWVEPFPKNISIEILGPAENDPTTKYAIYDSKTEKYMNNYMRWNKFCAIYDNVKDCVNILLKAKENGRIQTS